MSALRVGPVLTGGAVATGFLPSGTEVQFIGLPDGGVLMGMRPRSGHWSVMPVADPERFGDDWWTVKGMRKWIAAYEAAAEQEDE